MKWFPTRAAHLAELQILMRLEILDEVREATMLVRSAGNQLGLYLISAVPCQKWTLTVSATVSGTSWECAVPVPPGVVDGPADYSESGIVGDIGE